MTSNFGLIGAAGYIAPRHLRAIYDTGNCLVAAVDPHDSIGILDSYGFDVHFFTEIERFDRHLEKLKRGAHEKRVHYMSICSPNYLHDAHCRLALRLGADAICEKPLVINPWNLDPLQELETETGKRINTIMQLRLNPSLVKLREKLLQEKNENQHSVTLTYVTARGRWYHSSWKSQPEKSGGIATNIGIHLFDILLWLFGAEVGLRVYYSDSHRMSGFLELERARVKWLLSVHPADLPDASKLNGRNSHRSMVIDGEPLEFTEGMTDLHTRAYEKILSGCGLGIDDARPAINLAYKVRTAQISPVDDQAHPSPVK